MGMREWRSSKTGDVGYEHDTLAEAKRDKASRPTGYPATIYKTKTGYAVVNKPRTKKSKGTYMGHSLLRPSKRKRK